MLFDWTLKGLAALLDGQTLLSQESVRYKHAFRANAELVTCRCARLLGLRRHHVLHPAARVCLALHVGRCISARS